MGAFRFVDIVVEVVVLMGIVYSLFWALMLTSLDFGLEQKYKRYIGRVMTIVGGLALIFFVGHLVAFYPWLPH